MELTSVLTDAPARRKQIRAKALEGLIKAFPLTLRDKTIELHDPHVVERDFGPNDQKQALLEGSSLHEPVRATLVMKDAAGKEIERVKNFTLLNLPYFTERHTFVLDGNEYQVSNQIRMKPGVYTRKRANEELETSFNLSKGSNFRLSLDAKKGHPYMEYGTTTIPLYPVLRRLGVSHEDIAKAWGRGTAEENQRSFIGKEDQALAKLYGKIIHPAQQVAGSTDDHVAAIQAKFALTSMDPEVNKVTLGHAHDKVTPQAILDASHKLLSVYKSGDDVDDRDSLAFKTFHSVDDFIKERINLHARVIAMKTKGRAVNKTTIREIMPPSPFSADIRTFLTGSRLSSIPTQINPMEMIDQAVKVTSLGEGGISSDRAIPIEARQLHPTHLGILDPVRTPESFQAGVDIRAAMLTHRDAAGNLYTPVRNIKTGKFDYLSAKEMQHTVIAFPGQKMTGFVDAMKNGSVQHVPASEVHHELYHTAQLYSPTSNLIPMMESIQGNRATMGSKMQTQALPLVDRQVPWVQVGARKLFGGGKDELSSFEKELGKLVVPCAPQAGRVVKIDNQYIYIDPTGKKKVAAETPTPYNVPEPEFLKYAGEPKRQTTIKGIKMKVELEKGDIRRGVNKETGEPWEKEMHAAYGHIPKTRGHDGETVDIYLKEPGFFAEVYCVKQVKKDGTHDEDKLMVGFSSPDEAIECYKKHVPKWCFGSMQTLSWSEFEDYVDDYWHEKAAAEKNEDEGLIKIPYDTNFPFASKTYINHNVVVKVGDHVKEDQHLADSNFTRNGELALGRNMKVGYMAYYGLNSNDAVVISEGAATKLTSEHMYKEVLDVDQDMTLRRELHRLYYGAKYTSEMYRHLDAEGVIKKGEKVMPHDIIIAAVRKTKLSATDALLGNLKKSLANPYREEIRTWDHDFEGEVIDVFKADKRVVVTIKTKEPMRVGDKLSGRHGNKGVISHIVPDAKMIQDDGGKPIDILYTSAGVISRCYDAKTEFLTSRGWVFGEDVLDDDVIYNYDLHTGAGSFQKQTQAFFRAPYRGIMHAYAHKGLDFCVTPNHSFVARKAEVLGDPWHKVRVEDLFEKRWKVPTVGSVVGGTVSDFILPHINYSVKDTQGDQKDRSIPAVLFAEFLGWFLSEGHTVFSATDREYKVFVGQCDRVHPEYCKKIAALLDALPFKWTYKKSVRGFVIYSKRLASYCKQFGLAHQKYVDPWLFTQPVAVRQAFLDAVWAGDGSVCFSDGHETKTLGCTSERLVDDLQRLCLLQGISAIKRPIKKDPRGRQMWRCAIQLKKSDRLIASSSGKWKNIRYSGMVYCPSVPTGFVLTRRNGKPLIAGNTNPAQILETAIAKVAEKIGKPIIMENFTGRDNVQWAKDLLKKHDVQDKETVFDPISGKHIKGVLVGPQYTLRLFKTTDSNFSARGTGAYDVNQQPTKGGDEGAKGIGGMEFNGLVAHNARNVLRETSILKSQKNDAFWRAAQLGLPLPPLKTSFAYDKFEHMIQAAGIRLEKKGSTATLRPLTDHDIMKMSAGEVQNEKLVKAKNLEPERGGLFDPAVTGGPSGTKWSHIELAEPLLNPVFHEPVRRLLGLTNNALDELHAKEGGAALKKRLNQIDVVTRLAQLRTLAKTVAPSKLDDVVKQIKALEALKAAKLQPGDAYVLSKLPVLPPIMRPILPGQSGGALVVGDSNYLYQNAILHNQALQTQITGRLLPPDEHAVLRQNLFNAVGAVIGTQDSDNPKLQKRNVKGFIEHLTGKTTPKSSFFQKKLYKRQQDFSGRGTIAPDGSLGMDEVGIPEEMLWKMFSKFILTRLVRRGFSAVQANEMVEKRHPAARDALMAEIAERPVMVNRAPSLHRYNIVGAYAVPTPGKTIRVNPFIERGMNADYDGDTFQVHTPALPAAVQEVKQMTLSNLLFGDRSKDDLMIAPTMEAVLGMHLATLAPKAGGKVHRFKNKADAMAAYHRGEITLQDHVEIK